MFGRRAAVQLQVTYMELRQAPTAPALRSGSERIVRESPGVLEYLSLYRNVGRPLRWDQRLLMPEAELASLLGGGSLHVYVLRNTAAEALGFCEFDRGAFPEIELKNFGLIAEAQGRALGPWLLSIALREEWMSGATRIWLHTDTWDHPAAISVYQRAGFRVYATRDEEPGGL